jgi:acyl carrier protein
MLALDRSHSLGRSPIDDERMEFAMQTNIENRILVLVKSILEQNAIIAQIDQATRLVDVGLTSMDMVNLMLGVEAEFDFTIPQSEITPENFQSVETLERMVTAQLQLAAAN